MPHKPATGLTHQQFTAIFNALYTHLTWEKPTRTQKTHHGLGTKITLHYHRHNLTEELLAEFFNVFSQQFPGLSMMEKTLVKTLGPLTQPLGKPLDAPGSLVIDGTLVTT